jgi:soluble P-type ATPase
MTTVASLHHFRFQTQNSFRCFIFVAQTVHALTNVQLTVKVRSGDLHGSELEGCNTLGIELRSGQIIRSHKQQSQQ